nr:extracellular glycoprotein lacritin isoform X1 [Vicugna pacos]XP_031538737.1 extracellular glycoprotein lacritin isoform X1 [Vicugna pacos]
MRFTALLFLAALAGILVCAQNSTPVQEPVTPKANKTTTCVVESASPQKTTQETSAVTQEKTTLVFKPLRLGIGKGLGVEKGLELAKGAREKLREKFEDGKKLIEGVGKGLWVRKVSG